MVLGTTQIGGLAAAEVVEPRTLPPIVLSILRACMARCLPGYSGTLVVTVSVSVYRCQCIGASASVGLTPNAPYSLSKLTLPVTQIC